jgi:hypothetical protein
LRVARLSQWPLEKWSIDSESSRFSSLLLSIYAASAEGLLSAEELDAFGAELLAILVIERLIYVLPFSCDSMICSIINLIYVLLYLINPFEIVCREAAIIYRYYF